MSASSSSSSSAEPQNVRSGRSPIPIPGVEPVKEEDRLTGDTWTDVKRAFQRVSLKEDFNNMDRIPCLRTSLLYGIGGGVGIGAIRMFGTKRLKPSINWAMGSFFVISIFQWETCRRARAEELRKMRMIQERYPHRHVSKLQKRDGGE